MKTVLASTRLRRQFKHELFMKTKKSMELAKWFNFVSTKNVFIKIDCSSEYVVPGLCTSPWVLDSVIKVIKSRFKDCKIIVGDYGKDLGKNYRKWSIGKVCKENSVKLVNLYKTKKIKVGKFRIPRVIAEARSILSLPVAKTDYSTTISGTLKNMAGMTNGFMMNPTNIADLNKMVSADFIVCDATACLEGDGPVRGRPNLLDAIISSSDSVAMDCALCHMMGFSWRKVKHITESVKINVGEVDYKLVGDLPEDRFEMSKEKKRWFDNEIMEKYKNKMWYVFKGKRYAKKVVKKSALYEMEFGGLIEW